MEGCYVPNNPHYGLLELSGGSGLQQAPGQCSTGSSSYWSPEDMGSFSLAGLDLDPLPSLFPFSPCSNNYKSAEFGPVLKEKQPHDVADVLLSLKHAVVHPDQMSPNFSSYTSGGQQCGQASYQVPSASLSYTVHPHQTVMFVPPLQCCTLLQMMSPGGGYGSSQYCTGPQDQAAMFVPAPVTPSQHTLHAQHNMFPSMSVNVSMNMTMHGYPPTMDNLQHQMTCPQMQWGSAPPNSSPVYSQTSQGLLSPQTYPGATYSFTADFRPFDVVVSASGYEPKDPGLSSRLVPWVFLERGITPTVTKVWPQPVMPTETTLLGPNSPFKPLLNKTANCPNLTTSRPANSGSSRRSSTCYQRQVLCQSKVAASVTSEDSGRPNLCRICGKTYARPSTLKTHLRTHSGEKPYRCGDCNKSFSQAANLTAHVRTHSGEKPFRCPICDRRFSQSSSVTTHMRTHSGERPYRCRLCKKAFSDSSTLTKHLRIHSGEKPYQCKLCLLRFSQSGNLNRHMRVHGGSTAPA
uniref:Protein glass n=1 Tax=Timema genevievae TaxID=629358 RepID=A0A7R9PRB5_TIMGE|nr:unnamed protein product [Timema genevievae]